MPKLIPLRRHLVEMESRFPEELLNLFENMEGRSNPWGIALLSGANGQPCWGNAPLKQARPSIFFMWAVPVPLTPAPSR